MKWLNFDHHLTKKYQSLTEMSKVLFMYQEIKESLSCLNGAHEARKGSKFHAMSSSEHHAVCEEDPTAEVAAQKLD